MYFFIIQCVYFYLFDMFLRKKGFRWSWFALLAVGSALASALGFPQFTLEPVPGRDWQETWAYQAFILFGLLVIYPIQSVLMLKALKWFPIDPEAGFLKSAVQRAVMYMTTLMITAWLLTLTIVLLAVVASAVYSSFSHIFLP